MNRRRIWTRLTAFMLAVIMIVELPAEILAENLSENLSENQTEASAQKDAGDMLSDLLNTDESQQYYEVKFALPEEITEEEAEQIKLPDPVMLPADSLFYALPEPEWQNHTFNGWFYDAALTEPADGGDTAERNLTLYPSFTATEEYDDEFRINYMSDLDVEPDFTFELVSWGLTEEDLYDLVTVTDLSKTEEYASDSFVLERLAPDLETLIPDEDYREQAAQVLERFQAEELESSLTDALTAIEVRDESDPPTQEELFEASQESANRSSLEEALATVPEEIISALDSAVIAELVFYYAPEEAGETDAMRMADLLRRVEEAGFDPEAIKASDLIGIMTEEEKTLMGLDDPAQYEDSEEPLDFKAFVSPYKAQLPAAHFMLRPTESGWNRGDLHQVEILDTDAVRYLRGGELSGQYVIYYNITVHQDEFDNRRLAGGLVFLPASEVEGVTLDAGLFQAQADTDGNISVQKNEEEGVLTYSGSQALRSGLTVAVYDGVLKENGFVDGSVGYFRIREDLGGGRFAYESPDYSDVIFTPDVIPARDDGSFDDGETLLTADQLAFSGEPYESMGLDENTVVEPGDFLTIYTGSLTGEDTALTGYGCITSTQEAEGGLLVRYDIVSEETMMQSADMYMHQDNTPIPFSDEELEELARALEEDVQDSGFVDEAGNYIGDMVLKDEEAILPDSKYADSLTDVMFLREDGSEISLEEVRELAAGGSRVEIDWPPKFAFTVSLGLQHFENQTGIRFEGSVEVTITIKCNDNADIEIKAVALLEVEIALGLTAKFEVEWRKWTVFYYPYDISGHIGVTAGIYVGLGITITVVSKTPEDDDASLKKAAEDLDPNQYKDHNNNNADTAASQKADRLKKRAAAIGQIAENARAGTDGLGISKIPGKTAESSSYTLNETNKTATIENYQDAHNTVGGGFEDKYSNFIQGSDAEYVPFLEKPLLDTDLYTDPAHAIVIHLKITFVLAFKINVMLGVSVTYGNAKQAGADFTIFHPSATSTVGDLETPNFQCDFFVFGMLGIRVGFELDLRFGLITADVASIGFVLSIGLYLEFYGYFYVNYRWESGKGSSSEMFGSMLVQVGLYLELAFRAQMGAGLVQKDVNIYSLRVPLLSLGDEYCALDFEIDEDGDGPEEPGVKEDDKPEGSAALYLSILENTKENQDWVKKHNKDKDKDDPVHTVVGGASIQVPEELFDIKFLEISSGEIYSDNMDRSGAFFNKGCGRLTAGPVNFRQMDEQYFHVTYTPKGKDFADAKAADKKKGGFLYNPRDNTISAKPADNTADELWGEFTFKWYQNGPVRNETVGLNYGAGFGLNTREISRTVRVHWKGTPVTGQANIYIGNDKLAAKAAKAAADFEKESLSRDSEYIPDVSVCAFALTREEQEPYYEKKESVGFDGFDGVVFYMDTQNLSDSYPGYRLVAAKEEFNDKAISCYLERMDEGNSHVSIEFARFMCYAIPAVDGDESSKGWMMVNSADPYLFFLMHSPKTEVDLYFMKGQVETDWVVLKNDKYDFNDPLAHAYEVSVPLGDKVFDHVPDEIRTAVNTDTHAYDYVWFSYSDVRGAYDSARVRDTGQAIKYKPEGSRPRKYPRIEKRLTCMPAADEVVANKESWKEVGEDSAFPVRSTVYFAVRIPKPFNAAWEYDDGSVNTKVRVGTAMYAANGDAQRDHCDFNGWKMILQSNAAAGSLTDIAFQREEGGQISLEEVRELAAGSSEGENGSSGTMPASDVRMIPEFSGEWYGVYWAYNGRMIYQKAQYGEPLLAFAPLTDENGRQIEWYLVPDSWETRQLVTETYLTPADCDGLVLNGLEAPYTVTYMDGRKKVGEEKVRATWGSYIPLLQLTKKHYQLTWLLDGKPVTSPYTQMPHRDITLTARWTPNKYLYRWAAVDLHTQTWLSSVSTAPQGKTVADIWPEDDPRTKEDSDRWHLYRYDGYGRNTAGSLWNVRKWWTEVSKDDPLPYYDTIYVLYKETKQIWVTWKYKNGDQFTLEYEGEPLKAPTDQYAPGDVITGWHDEDGNVYETAPNHDITLYPEVKYHEHVWNDGVTMRRATCSVPGRVMYTCDVCRETKYEETPMLDHDYLYWYRTFANCTEPGLEYYRCRNCDAVYTEVWADAHGHNEGSPERENVTAATCTGNGSYDTVVKCTYCGEELSRVTTTVPALGHAPAGKVFENGVNPSCTEPGSHDEVVYCSRCSEELSRKNVTDEPWGHDYKGTVTDPTCTKEGFTTYICTRCGDSYVDDKTDALGHDYVSKITPATCIEDGYTTHTCSRCDDSYVDSIVPAAGAAHKPGKPVRTEPYPIWEEGNGGTYCTGWHAGDITTRCTVCNAVLSTEPVKITPTLLSEFAMNEDSETLTLPESFFWEWGTGHAAEGAVLSDLEVPGWAAVTSGGMQSVDRWNIDAEITWEKPDMLLSDIKAGDVLGVHIKPLEEYADICTEANVEINVIEHEHAYTGEEVTQPTCSQKGYTTYTCEQCGVSYVDNYVDALGHKWGEWTVTKEAGEYEDGSRKRVCGGCGEEETEVLPATGHIHTLKKTEAVNATCTEDGNTTYWTCTGCGLYFSDAEGTKQIENGNWVISATGHKWGKTDYSWSEDNTKVTAERVCTVDGSHKQTETVKAVRSDEESSAATCKAEGLDVFKASFTNPAFEAKEKRVVLPVDPNAHALEHHAAAPYAENLESGEFELDVLYAGQAFDVCTRCGAQLNETLVPVKPALLANQLSLPKLLNGAGDSGEGTSLGDYEGALSSLLNGLIYTRVKLDGAGRDIAPILSTDAIKAAWAEGYSDVLIKDVREAIEADGVYTAKIRLTPVETEDGFYSESGQYRIQAAAGVVAGSEVEVEIRDCDHDFVETGRIVHTDSEDGEYLYKCQHCGIEIREVMPAGHVWELDASNSRTTAVRDANGSFLDGEGNHYDIAFAGNAYCCSLCKAEKVEEEEKLNLDGVEQTEEVFLDQLSTSLRAYDPGQVMRAGLWIRFEETGEFGPLYVDGTFNWAQDEKTQALLDEPIAALLQKIREDGNADEFHLPVVFTPAPAVSDYFNKNSYAGEVRFINIYSEIYHYDHSGLDGYDPELVNVDPVYNGRWNCKYLNARKCNFCGRIDTDEAEKIKLTPYVGLKVDGEVSAMESDGVTTYTITTTAAAAAAALGEDSEVRYIANDSGWGYMHYASSLYKLFYLYYSDDGTTSSGTFEDWNARYVNKAKLDDMSTDLGENTTMNTKIIELTEPLTVRGTASEQDVYNAVKIVLMIQPSNSSRKLMLQAAPTPESGEGATEEPETEAAEGEPETEAVAGEIVTEAAAESETELAEKAAERAAEAGEAEAEEVAVEAVEAGTEKAAEEVVEAEGAGAEETAEAETEAAEGTSAEMPETKAAEEASKEQTKDPAEDTSPEPAEKPAEEIMKEPAGEPSKESSEKPAKVPETETAPEPVKEVFTGSVRIELQNKGDIPEGSNIEFKAIVNGNQALISIFWQKLAENDKTHQMEWMTIEKGEKLIIQATEANAAVKYRAALYDADEKVCAEAGIEFPRFVHVPGKAVRENETAATCTAEGHYDSVVRCTVCGKELSRKTKTIEKIAHVPAGAVRENETAATCAAEGHYDEVVRCAACGKELSRVVKTIAKTAHTPAGAVHENEAAATCTAEGHYDEVVRCAVCGKELSREKKTISKTAHTPGKAVRENVVEATSDTEDSYEEVVYCEVCGEELSRVTKD